MTLTFPTALSSWPADVDCPTHLFSIFQISALTISVIKIGKLLDLFQLCQTNNVSPQNKKVLVIYLISNALSYGRSRFLSCFKARFSSLFLLLLNMFLFRYSMSEPPNIELIQLATVTAAKRRRTFALDDIKEFKQHGIKQKSASEINQMSSSDDQTCRPVLACSKIPDPAETAADEPRRSGRSKKPVKKYNPVCFIIQVLNIKKYIF